MQASHLESGEDGRPCSAARLTVAITFCRPIREPVGIRAASNNATQSVRMKLTGSGFGFGFWFWFAYLCVAFGLLCSFRKTAAAAALFTGDARPTKRDFLMTSS